MTLDSSSDLRAPTIEGNRIIEDAIRAALSLGLDYTDVGASQEAVAEYLHGLGIDLDDAAFQRLIRTFWTAIERAPEAGGLRARIEAVILTTTEYGPRCLICDRYQTSNDGHPATNHGTVCTALLALAAAPEAGGQT